MRAALHRPDLRTIAPPPTGRVAAYNEGSIRKASLRWSIYEAVANYERGDRPRRSDPELLGYRASKAASRLPTRSSRRGFRTPPPEEQKLRDLLASLPENIIYLLALIMYLGRGGFGTDDLAGQYEALQQTFERPERATAQMMAKAPLADYLTDGLAELEKSGIDVDDLTFTSVQAGS